MGTNYRKERQKTLPANARELKRSGTLPLMIGAQTLRDSRKTQHFGFWSHFIPSLLGRDRLGFSDVKQRIDQYRDLQWIIDRLHQVEILKRILLTQKQVAIMESIPKTEIVETKKDGRIAFEVHEKPWDTQDKVPMYSKDDIENLINQVSEEELNDTKTQQLIQLLKYKANKEDAINIALSRRFSQP
eukprot:TRINITY_DN7519_c0_g2_i1.p1 TRINITY_DN7519_c0_g2~~TRINITY_DN7519_c0_g2_i1.p1  ORF type:complete len:187 (-),score=21.55 TRINITY_DN7519_c0_g2_i1:99-659(-)